MSERRQSLLWLCLGLVICISLAYTAGFAVYQLRGEALGARLSGPAEAKVFWEAWERIDRHYFGDPPSAKTRTYGAIRRSLALLDPYTVFIEPVSRELERDELQGKYGGIGVTVWRDAQGRIALDPHPGSPAQRAGLTKGDLLLSIDGEPLGDAATESEVKARLRGEVGTRVRLTIARPSGSRFKVTITRATIEVPSVTWRMETPGIGYVRVTRFTERTDSELASALARLREAEPAGVVLDLRGNRGGLLETAVAVAGRFLREGDTVLHQTGRVDQRTYRAQTTGDLTMPLAVLVDDGTASAAEIVAGALQDNDRAVLVGEQTFGKGSVQEIYDLSDGSSVHITAAIWLTPDRHRIDQNGLAPDLAVSSKEADSADEPLRRAVSYLESE